MVKEKSFTPEKIIDGAHNLVDSSYSLSKGQASSGKLDIVQGCLENIEVAHSRLEGLSSDAKTKYRSEIGTIEEKIKDTRKYIGQTCLEAINQNLSKFNEIATKDVKKSKKDEAELALKNAIYAKLCIDKLGEGYTKLAEYGRLDTKLEIAQNKFKNTYSSK